MTEERFNHGCGTFFSKVSEFLKIELIENAKLYVYKMDFQEETYVIVSGGQNNGNYDGMKSTEILDIEGVEWQKGIYQSIPDGHQTQIVDNF